tara:strand:- start:180 stop:395 length:216 start_codon:yes stop_codon:yes gene_type:complete
MKSLFLNIKNLIPYLLLIAIYFFFVNIEARNGQNTYKNNKTNRQENKSNYDNFDVNDSSGRISIPVIPYNK